MKHRALFAGCLLLAACQSGPKDAGNQKIHLVTLAPGHFHAALVQKSMYEEIDSNVNVFAPAGPELDAHMALVNSYNQRPENPTHWAEKVYTGPDFLEKMAEAKIPNAVVVIAGNNRDKTSYIRTAVNAGMNVLADKPMAITAAGFGELERIMDDAAARNVLLYDIMTERSEITNILQKELLQDATVFGSLQPGSPDTPSVVIESVHHFFKSVSGKPLRRPQWFFDPAQQGDAMTDVNTHLVDLAQWICFDTLHIDYKKDIRLLAAKKWPTPISRAQFTAITGATNFPAFLQPLVKNDSMLQTAANGSIDYSLNGVHIRAIALWNYQAPEGGGDTHDAIIRGTKATLHIRQGKDENWKPELYVIPAQADTSFGAALQASVGRLAQRYPGLGVTKTASGWKLQIPDALRTTHEAHFAEVAERFLKFLQAGRIPEWERKNIIAKYYVTTGGLALAGGQ
ncbi:putative oxidoreductase C-terminal domain-containing protein [Chitinophaga lutea]